MPDLFKKTLYIFLILSLTLSACDNDTAQTSSNIAIETRLKDIERQLAFADKRILSLEKSTQSGSSPNIDNPIISRNINFQLDDGFFDDPFFGSIEPEKIIIIYTDLNCHQCKKFLRSTFEELKKHFKESVKVQVRLRDFPFKKTAISKPLAIAAHCAGEKGKYWEFLSTVLSIKENISTDDIKTIAAKVLDEKDTFLFEKCLQSDKYSREIEMDKAHGISLGIKGSPSVVLATKVEGRNYTGTLIRGNQAIGVVLEELSFLKK